MATIVLVHALAIAVGLGSTGLYLAAFFFPEVHRRHDFFWCGLGWFYALVLWTCAGQITGAVALGQVVSLVLLAWFCWQTLALRRLRTPVELQTPASAEAWQTFQDETADLLRGLLGQTPLGRLFPSLRPTRITSATAAYGNKLRASALKDVGYEYLDDVEDEPTIAAPRPKSSAPISPPRPVRQSTVSRSPASTAPTTTSRSNQPKTRPADGNRRNPVQILKITAGWMQDVVKGLTRSKPSKPVIDLPPRPPSIPRPGTASRPGADRPGPGDSAPASEVNPIDPEDQPAAGTPTITILDTDAIPQDVSPAAMGTAPTTDPLTPETRSEVDPDFPSPAGETRLPDADSPTVADPTSSDQQG